MAPVSADEVERLIARWKPLLGLERWDIKLRYHPGVEEETDEDWKSSYAYTVADPGYSSAVVTFNLYNIPPEQLENTVVHELCHVLTKPMESIVDDTLGKKFEETARQLEESLVSSLASAFVAAYHHQPGLQLVCVKMNCK